MCRRWIAGQTDRAEHRREVVNHALRLAIKQGDPAALAVMGAETPATVEVSASFSPAQPEIGGAVDVTVTVRNPTTKPQDLLVDLAIQFVKASGKTGRKVFKLARVEVPGGGQATLRRRVALQQMSTRTHHPGWHAVEVQVNGASTAAGGFELKPFSG